MLKIDAAWVDISGFKDCSLITQIERVGGFTLKLGLEGWGLEVFWRRGRGSIVIQIGVMSQMNGPLQQATNTKDSMVLVIYFIIKTKININCLHQQI